MANKNTSPAVLADSTRATKSHTYSHIHTLFDYKLRTLWCMHN